MTGSTQREMSKHSPALKDLLASVVPPRLDHPCCPTSSEQSVGVHQIPSERAEGGGESDLLGSHILVRQDFVRELRDVIDAIDKRVSTVGEKRE
jgi:hypothetical protein